MSGLRSSLIGVLAVLGAVLVPASQSGFAADATPTAAAAPGGGSTTVTALSVLNNIACASATHCVAVGSDSAFSGRSVAIATKTSKVTVGSGSVGDASLNAVACPTTSRCVAVSDEQVASVNASTGAIKQTAKLKAPKNGIVALGDVACESKSVCYGVGFEGPSTASKAIIAVLSGSGSLRRVMKVKGTGIGSISCATHGRCLMSVADAGKTGIQVLRHGHLGARHTLASNEFVQSISCFKGTRCVALAGRISAGIAKNYELIPLNPNTAKTGKTVKVAGFTAFALTCFSATKCIVVGEKNGSMKPAAVIVTGATVGKPKSYAGSSFHAAACANATHCYGVGDKGASAFVDRL
jgi:hypothetical protein